MLSSEWSSNIEHRLRTTHHWLPIHLDLVRCLWRLFNRSQTISRTNITCNCRATGTATPSYDSSLLLLSIVIALMVAFAAISPVSGETRFISSKPASFEVFKQAIDVFKEPLLVSSLRSRRHTLPLSYENDSNDNDHKSAVQNAPFTGLGSHYLLGRTNSSSVMRKPKFMPSTSTTTSTTSTTERTIYTFDLSELALDDPTTPSEISLFRHSTPVSSVTDVNPLSSTVFHNQLSTSRPVTNSKDISIAKNEPDRLYREFVARLREMHALDVVVTLVGSILALLTIFGNVLVVVAFKIDRSLQTLSNYFLISLAFADFLIGCISMPLSLIYMLAKGWFLGPNVCDFWLSFDYLNSNSSVLNLLLISFDRYFSVLTPLSYRAIRSRGRIVLAIVVAWTLSSLLWPPWILAWSTIEGRRTVPDHMCYIPFLESNPGVTVVTAIAAFWLPVSIMIYLYFCIYIETERRYHDLNRLEKIAFSGRNTPPSKKFRIFRKKNISSSSTDGLRNCSGYTTTALTSGITQFNSSTINTITSGTGIGNQQHLPNCPRTLKKLVCQTSGEAVKNQKISKSSRSSSVNVKSDFPIELSKGISASGYPVPKLAKGSPVSKVNIFSTHDYANEIIQLEQIGLLTDNNRSVSKCQMSVSRQISLTSRSPSVRLSWWNRLGWCRSSFETSQPTFEPFNKANCPGCIRRHRLRKVRQGVRFRAEQALQEKLEHETSKQIYTIVINLPKENTNCTESFSKDSKPTVRMLYEPESSKPYKTKRSRRVSARMPDISETDSDDSELSPYVDSDDDDDNSVNIFSESQTVQPSKSVLETNGGGHHDSNNNLFRSSTTTAATVATAAASATAATAMDYENGSAPFSVATSKPRATSLLCFICCFFFRCHRQPETHRNSSTSVITTTARAYLRANISIKSERKAAKMLSAILLTFIITWTPYNVIVIIKTFKPDMIDSEGFLWQISYYLCYINSTINPICYAMCNKNFRHTYMQILTCKFSSRRRAPILANATRGAAGPGVMTTQVSRQLDERRRQQRFQ